MTHSLTLAPGAATSNSFAAEENILTLTFTSKLQQSLDTRYLIHTLADSRLSISHHDSLTATFIAHHGFASQVVMDELFLSPGISCEPSSGRKHDTKWPFDWRE